MSRGMDVTIRGYCSRPALRRAWEMYRCAVSVYPMLVVQPESGGEVLSQSKLGGMVTVVGGSLWSLEYVDGMVKAKVHSAGPSLR